jgi:hypothetical protein
MKDKPTLRGRCVEGFGQAPKTDPFHRLCHVAKYSA